MNPLIYDIETKCPVPPKDGKYIKGVRYCKGWTDYLGMGIACLVAFDLKHNKVLVYDESDIEQFQAVIDAADSCVTFNGDRFDNKLLAAHGVTVPQPKSADLCAILRKATNYQYSLGDLCRVNFDAEKTEDGAMAPVYYQRGEVMRVIRYCISDVSLTAKLYRQIRDRQSILCPKTGQTFAVTMAQNGELF